MNIENINKAWDTYLKELSNTLTAVERLDTNEEAIKSFDMILKLAIRGVRMHLGMIIMSSHNRPELVRKLLMEIFTVVEKEVKAIQGGDDDE